MLRRQRVAFDAAVALEREALRYMRPLSIIESVAQWLALQRAFESQLQETAPLFAPEREAALAELQARLQRLGEARRPDAGNTD